MTTNKGKLFEQQFKKSVPDECLLVRLNDPPAAVKSSVVFLPNNPCDYLVFDSKRRVFVPLELKSTKSRSMPYSMIRQNQIDGLTGFSRYDNVFPGFLLNYRIEELDIERCYYIGIDQFNKMMAGSDKKSFNEADVMRNGGINVRGKKARVRWTWDVEDLLDTLVSD